MIFSAVFTVSLLRIGVEPTVRSARRRDSGGALCSWGRVPAPRNPEPSRFPVVVRKRAMLLAGACLAGAVLGTPSAGAATPVPKIKVLSNRADLVSGGDALVQVKVPRGVRASRVKLFAGRRNVTKSLDRVGRRRLQGLVTDLRDGKTRLVARVRHGGAARLIVRNHPDRKSTRLNSSH